MALQGPALSEAKELFRIYCIAKGLSPRTVETYLFSIERLEMFLSQDDRIPQIPDHHELRQFIGYMLERRLSRQTVRVRMRSIRVFLSFLEREGAVQESPMRWVEIPRVPESIPTVLTDDQMAALIKAFDRPGWHSKRNRAIVMTFLDTGVRLSELIGLDLSDVDLRQGSVLVRNGKGARDRTVYAGHSLRRALRQWVEARGVSPSCPGLFITKRDTRIHRRYIGRIVENAASRAHLSGLRVHPHALRHSFATAYIRHGGDVFSLQSLLGHSTVTTTRRYVTFAGTSLQEAHAKASPVDRLSR